MASWSTGFCGCFSDCSSCCLTLWCPCVAFGRVAEIVDKGTTSSCVHGLLYCLLGGFSHFGSIYACIYRTKLRRVFGIHGSQTCDCIASCCCVHISLCQEHRELEARGFNVSAGWKGNVQMGSRGVTAAPALQGGMSR
ncbi:protein PLANT CADMIUM RESISTANCE 3-like [Vicia villosa]|uniref:protein PLANT CADMIUM RESISTANCE 3-like n=1 Tax=Vicia villosa TaxID=3911 RepID=UPI00273C9584|nr:protein PLANT CADMIUM RESISTANCE 3-like [Vicia villosa]